MTLDDLYADFVKARADYAQYTALSPVYDGTISDIRQATNWCRNPDAAVHIYGFVLKDQKDKLTSHQLHRIARWGSERSQVFYTAMIYCIARDSGFPEAILWKLSNA